MIESENLLESSRQISGVFRQRLEQLAGQHDAIEQVRVLGLMIGVELSVDGGPIVKACMDRGLLINCTQGTVLRLLPAMNLTTEQVHQGCDVLAEAIGDVTG